MKWMREMSLADHVESLLQMATELEAIGERDLGRECRDTATRILDYVAWINFIGGGSHGKSRNGEPKGDR